MATNATSNEPTIRDQGAKPAQRDENSRVGTVVLSENTNIAHPTQQSENERIGTV